MKENSASLSKMFKISSRSSKNYDIISLTTAMHEASKFCLGFKLYIFEVKLMFEFALELVLGFHVAIALHYFLVSPTPPDHGVVF